MYGCSTACLASFLLLSVSCFAEDDRWTMNIYFENDLFAETDLNYTNGVRASFISPDVDSFFTQREEAYHG